MVSKLGALALALARGSLPSRGLGGAVGARSWRQVRELAYFRCAGHTCREQIGTGVLDDTFRAGTPGILHPSSRSRLASELLSVYCMYCVELLV